MRSMSSYIGPPAMEAIATSLSADGGTITDACGTTGNLVEDVIGLLLVVSPPSCLEASFVKAVSS